MQYKQTSLRILFLLFPVVAFSQTTYLPEDAKDNILLERLEVKACLRPVVDGKVFPIPYQLRNKPYSRKTVTEYVQSVDSASKTGNSCLLSAVDQFNIHRLEENNLEWVQGSKEAFASRKPFLKNFYT